MDRQSTFKRHWWSRRRALAAIVAIAICITALLAGTFAWNAISQMALNETIDNEVNPGGRLHDDFDGQNLDIYVENYGTSPLYAKVRLYEYMETGQGAGMKGTFMPAVDQSNTSQLVGDGKGIFAADTTNNHAVPYKSGALIGDVSTWSVHTPGASGVTNCGREAIGKFHDSWAWSMGGQKVYMPTFNKDGNSLASDIKGLDTTGMDSDTYKSRVNDPRDVGAVTSGSGAHDQYALGDMVTEGATYTGGVLKPEDHTAKKTLPGTVITMSEWKTTKNSEPGPYWVLADDGWAYWAETIKPDTATGLLLDHISLQANIEDDWYYAIEPEAAFATLNEIDALKVGADTNGQLLLDVITAPTVTAVTVYPDAVTLEPGDTQMFSAVVTGENFPGQEVTYSLVPAAGSVIPMNPATTVDSKGALKVSRDELNTELMLTVTPTADTTKAVTVTVKVNVPFEEFVYDLSKGPSNSIFGATNLDVILLVGDDPDNNYIVDWGDGTVPTLNTASHTYPAQDTYTITVSGRTPGGIAFNAWCVGGSYSIGEKRLTEVKTPLLWQSSTSVSWLFGYCSNLITIPSELFYSNTDVTEFGDVFRGCSNLEAIPHGLFDKNTEATGFGLVFYSCISLTEIPPDLFAKNTKATSFGTTFSFCSGLTEIPSDLFDNNTEVMFFGYVFRGCTGLTEIPFDLFDNNRKAIQFENAFQYCNNLTSIPDWWNTNPDNFPQFHLNLTENANALRMFAGCESAANNYLSVVPADWK